MRTAKQRGPSPAAAVLREARRHQYAFIVTFRLGPGGAQHKALTFASSADAAEVYISTKYGWGADRALVVDVERQVDDPKLPGC